MSLYGVLRSGVSGMNAQSNKLGTVAENIQNSSTTGYKRASTEFASLILPSSEGNYNSGSVTSRVRYTIADQGPIITNFPIWLGVATGAEALALPNESPASVADLATHFGSRLLVMVGDEHGDWPAVLDEGGPGTECFHELAVPVPADPKRAEALDDVRVFEVACP